MKVSKFGSFLEVKNFNHLRFWMSARETGIEDIDIRCLDGQLNVRLLVSTQVMISELWD